MPSGSANSCAVFGGCLIACFQAEVDSPAFGQSVRLAMGTGGKRPHFGVWSWSSSSSRCHSRRSALSAMPAGTPRFTAPAAIGGFNSEILTRFAPVWPFMPAFAALALDTTDWSAAHSATFAFGRLSAYRQTAPFSISSYCAATRRRGVSSRFSPAWLRGQPCRSISASPVRFVGSPLSAPGTAAAPVRSLTATCPSAAVGRLSSPASSCPAARPARPWVQASAA